MSLLTDKWWDLVKFTSLRLFHFIDYEMNYAIEIPWRLWDEEKLCYFVKQMDIRNKNPYLFRALAFDRLLKNVLFVLRNHIYICMFSYRSVPPRPVLSVHIFRMRFVCRAEIADFQSHREWYYRLVVSYRKT